MDAILTRLQNLIKIPSFSREENRTADYLALDLQHRGIETERLGNNVIAQNKYWKTDAPVLVLNSHHDTVKPASSYTRDPFAPTVDSGKLYGLGSNDAGAALCCLIETFIDYYDDQELPFNLLLVASAEEEISGAGGIQAVLDQRPLPWAAIVGEPTQMRAAVAERGLMVVDGIAIGVAGHAARLEGENALYMACDDIAVIRKMQFIRQSDYLPDTQAVVTQIEAGTQHNVIPDRCSFVIDVRVNDQYRNEEVFEMLNKATLSTLKARSFRLNSSLLPDTHPLSQVISMLRIEKFGSPTLSDQALMNFPSLKIGPGKSARSHTADEFIELAELEDGYRTYKKIIDTLKNQMT